MKLRLSEKTHKFLIDCIDYAKVLQMKQIDNEFVIYCFIKSFPNEFSKLCKYNRQNQSNLHSKIQNKILLTDQYIVKNIEFDDKVISAIYKASLSNNLFLSLNKFMFQIFNQRETRRFLNIKYFSFNDYVTKENIKNVSTLDLF